MPREPCAKGTSFLPLVVAIKNLPNRHEIVPQELWKYFDEHIVVSGWYPERDFFVLIQALVGTMDPKVLGDDPWRFIGSTSAQRDIGATQDRLPVESRVTQGVYRHLARSDANDVEHFIRRSVMLWSQYHDTGKMEIRGGRKATNAVVVRLLGFAIPVDGYLDLQVGYMEEFARLVGIKLVGKVTRRTTKGDPFCEWEYALERNPVSEAFIASLPAVT